MKYYSLFFIVCCFCVNTGFSQSSDTMFAEYDANSDNELTIDEFTSYYNNTVVSKCGTVVERMNSTFDKEDSNGDGFITADESEFAMMRFSSNPRTAHLIVDGKISRADFTKCPMFDVQQIFDDFDQDKNNIISKHEWDLKKRAGYRQ